MLWSGCCERRCQQNGTRAPFRWVSHAGEPLSLDNISHLNNEEYTSLSCVVRMRLVPTLPMHPPSVTTESIPRTLEKIHRKYRFGKDVIAHLCALGVTFTYL